LTLKDLQFNFFDKTLTCLGADLAAWVATAIIFFF
tara:strand:+ start:210 stop:314 length:105 start_codon:yes stop_codon:yes gene_type:complete